MSQRQEELREQAQKDLYDKLDAQSRPLWGRIASLKAEIADMEQQIANRKAEITDMEQQIANRKAEITDMEQQIKDIYAPHEEFLTRL